MRYPVVMAAYEVFVEDVDVAVDMWRFLQAIYSLDYRRK
jgi:hypothetical protein